MKNKPDDQDKIYFIDGPNIQYNFGQNDSFERYDDFRTFVTLGDSDKLCSEYEAWHWIAWWKKGANPQITKKDVDTGPATVPLETAPHYPAP